MYNQPVHIIVLTRDRPETLQRCVQQMKLGQNDKLTILDDSCNEAFLVSRCLLQSLPIAGELSHLATSQLFMDLKSKLPEDALEWTRRRADCDIAPLRNLSLLISACHSSELTFLLDDDITEFDLHLTRRSVEKILKANSVGIVGVYIAGTSEDGVIDNLERAVEVTDMHREEIESIADIRPLFETSTPKLPSNPVPVDYVSGGYLAFRLSPESLFAFPPGFNEDWLWCLEIVRRGIAKVFRLPQVVRHDPPCVKSVTRENIRFELLGDLIFDLVMQTQTSPGTEEMSANTQMFTFHVPSIISNDILPITRVYYIIEQSYSCPFYQRLLDVGLGLLEQMLFDGSLGVDWRSEVLEWRRDAKKKRRSFSLAINAHRDVLQCLLDQREFAYEQ